ncbi:MAG: 50S ribosomal protein L17 [Deltaproteobacteria bacterium HGW-Deltaproteobacteria-19]|jgi:large subunit ribosomal protein L17|nr:MAG: 50S ribosomal protein L17 [Deltaproteobacteria bacterium HGW-Deltaproteobacteria-19]
MRHRKLTTKLGRTSSHRKAMFRNMVTSFLKYEKIETTDIKAKELRRVAEKMVTLGKRGDLHARRQALAYVRDRDVVEKLFEQISSRFKERKGGYTRIVKTGYRTGDNAPMALIEFVGGEKEKAQKAKKTQKGKQKTA